MVDDPQDAPLASPEARPRESSGTPPGPGARHQSWTLSFVLFAAGFVILVVASKIGPAPLWGPVLKGFGVASCVVGFLLARRDRTLKL